MTTASDSPHVRHGAARVRAEVVRVADPATPAEAERLAASWVRDKPSALEELRAAALRFALPGDL